MNNVDTERNPDGTLKKGHKPLAGCGGPKLGAVSKIRAARNEIISAPENIEKYKKALQALLDKCPIECVDKYIPLFFPDGTDELPEDLAKLVAEQLRDMDEATVGGNSDE